MAENDLESFNWRPFCFLAAILFFTFWLRVVKIYFHAKFRPSSSKIERFSGHFVFWRPFCFVAAILFLAAIFFHFWVRAVKIYLHAKFRASSSKIERVIVLFVLFTFFTFFCSEMAAGGQDLLACKISCF